MRITPPIEDAIKRRIRDAMALDPLITISGLQQHLEEDFDRTFSFYYVRKLMNKIATQARIEGDCTKIEDRLTTLRETHRLAREKLLRILYWSPMNSLPGIKAPLPTDIAEAAKNIVMLDIAVLNAELANGMYKEPIDAIAKEIRYDPLPAEVRAVIIASWKRGWLLPAATIEKMVPAQSRLNG